VSGAGETSDTLLELLAARGPSGQETAPAAVWVRAARAFAAHASIDVVGTPSALVRARDSVGATDGSSEPGPGGPAEGALSADSRSDSAGASVQDGPRRLVVMGHIDEIGLVVTHIDDDGFLWFRGVGGWDPQILVGQRVVLASAGGDVRGVIGRKPIHLLRDEERKKVAELRDLHIDVGAKDGEEAAALVRVGDVGVIDAEPLSLPHRRIVSRALDNRLGSFVALEAARLVAEAGGIDGWELVAVAAAQEETTLGGARTSAFSLQPDAAIVVDVTHATDAPGIDVKEAGKHTLGSGPVLSRGSILHPALFERLVAAGDAAGIDYTVEASGRNTGTDADAVHISRGGVATALVSIPLRYMHSPVELVQLDDVEACARLIAAMALRLGGETVLSR
jgi:endoglucanase